MNTYHPSAEPVLYICPSATTSAQLVFNLRNWKIQLVSDVTISMDPRACGLLLARSALHRPSGSLATPDAAAYEERLAGLLEWVADPDNAVVTHHPLNGLPTDVRTYVPWLDPDGSLLMLPSDATPISADTPPTAATGTPAELLDLAAPNVPTDAGTATWDSLTATTDANAALALLQRTPDTPLVFKPGYAKKGLSAARWSAYSAAKTYTEYMSAHVLLPGNGPRPIA
jgi:hypothetical protein